MKYVYVVGLISSLLINPGILSAQSVNPSQLVVEPVSSSEIVISEQPVVSIITTSEIVEPINITSAVITIINEPIIEIENPALDVSYCGKKSIYASGTYDQYDKPVKAPICTLYDVRYASYATVDFGKTETLPVHHFEVHNDGRIVFTEKMDISEIGKKIIQGETDSQYYMVSGNDIEHGITLLPEYIVKSYLGDNYKDKVVYFDDSIVYSYKIVK